MGEVRVSTIVAGVFSLLFHVTVAGVLIFPRHHASLPEDDPAPALAGETFELPAPEMADAPLANASPSPEMVAPTVDELDGPTTQLTPPVHGQKGQHASHQGRPSGGRTSSPDGTNGGSGSGALYGAVGDRAATDLATAFVHGFRQVASADPTWRTTALGPTGDGTIILTLDESGHISDSKVTGNPSDALGRGIRGTVALLKARPFTAKGKTTTLKFSGAVSADKTVGDGLHGEVFALGSSFTGSEGSAFFALAIGRRIDIKVRSR